jgi:hypothetical protein
MINGPFGLVRGMRKDEFQCNLDEIAPYKYLLSEVPKPHSAFNMYVAMITPGHGLSWMKAIGKDVSTNPFGMEIRSSFESMKAKLENIYSRNDVVDFLMQGSIWSEPRDWMQALELRERVLMAVWESKHGSAMKDSLSSIALLAAARDINTGYISVEYEFDIHAAAEQAIASQEDEAL